MVGTVRGSAVLAGLVVIVSVVFPRIVLMGSLPSTDEGVGAYYSQIIHASLAAGGGLPDTGTLSLYPMLMSWVFAIPVNHIIGLRMADMIVACASCWLLYRVVEHESGSRIGGALVSLLFLFTMNQPMFIQSGFKNSIFAAYVALLLAVRLTQRAATREEVNWLQVGALVSVSVLLRETFIPFLFVGAAAIFISRGTKSFVRFCLGVSATAAAVCGVAMIARGGMHALADSYRTAGVLYASMEALRIPLLVNGATASAREAMMSLGVGAAALVVIVSTQLRPDRPPVIGRLVFWLAVALVPLIEPVTKIGFPYHFSVCLPGLAGLAALGWRCLSTAGSTPAAPRVAGAILAVCVLSLYPKVLSLTNTWNSTRDNLASAASEAWPVHAVASSNYLLAADAIRKAAPPGSSLSISGFMFALYPLTGMQPPAYEMSHLSAIVINCRLDEACFAKALKACPPDVLMTTTRTDWPGAAVLSKVVEESGLYREFARIAVSPDRSYGTFGGTVFSRLDPLKGDCRVPSARRN